MACFCSALSLRFWRKGLTPILKGQLGQETAVHFLTSMGCPQQQSKHRSRMAFRGFRSLWYRARISEGTSLGCLPISSPSSTGKGICRKSLKASTEGGDSNVLMPLKIDLKEKVNQ
jgi:hypothetical protein